MHDLISRQAAIDAIHEDADWLAAQGSDWQVERMERDKSILKSLPSAQPERKKGKWKRTYLDHEAMGERPSIFYCSVCNQCIAYPLNFCPSCGSDMRGGGK